MYGNVPTGDPETSGWSVLVAAYALGSLGGLRLRFRRLLGLGKMLLKPDDELLGVAQTSKAEIGLPPTRSGQVRSAEVI